MKSWLFRCGVAVLISAASMFAQAPAKAKDVPSIPVDFAPDFLKLPPGLNLGECMGIATNSKGHIFVFTRMQGARLFEFDAKGVWLRELGEGLYGFAFAHTVRVDSQDNIWAVDEGTNMVIKFNPEGRVVTVLGRRPEAIEGLPPSSTPAQDEPYLFSRPTDVTWDPAGDIFVADGYGNSRVVKYDKNGRFLKATGSHGSAPGEMNLPHTIAADAKGNIYEGDRSNSRIQVFDNDLKLKTVFDQVGAPWAVCISPGPHQYLYSSNSNPDSNLAAAMLVTGEIYKMELDGTILGKFGKPGKEPGEFGTVHEIDCRTENQLMVSEITNWRVQKLTLRPTAQAGK